ncbi:MAG: MmgE/PrpD family protein, partial [Oscillospiraceae bacterium]|nr:MmgE/PrpD family protein [Oscillospiraceae bacterium]
YTGNAYTLDSEFGFPFIYCREPGVWDPAKVLDGIGEQWLIMKQQFKPYPCCRYIHASLDMFYSLQKKYKFEPGDIKAIRCNTGAFVAHPDQYSVHNQVDAQFSMPYNIALAAFGYAPGPAWQEKKSLTDPRVLEFMHKITLTVADRYNELKKQDKRTFYSCVEIDLADGRTVSESEDYARGSSVEGFRLTDEELVQRFRTCASVILPDEKTERAIDIIMNLEKYDSLDELARNITL